MIQFSLHGLHMGGAPKHRAGDDVRMSVEVLGGAVERKIKAQSDRAEVQRRCESIVDHRNQPMVLRKSEYCLEVPHLQQWIGDGFDVKSPRVRSNVATPLRGVVEVNEGELDPGEGKSFAMKTC